MIAPAPRSFAPASETFAVLCVRVGLARFSPRGFRPSTCRLCGHPVWLHPRAEAIASGLRIPLMAFCCVCAEEKIAELGP